MQVAGISIPRLVLTSNSSPRPKCEPVAVSAIDYTPDILSTCPLSFSELMRSLKQERDRGTNSVVMCGGTDAMVLMLSQRTPVWLLNWLPDVTLCYSMTFTLLFSTLVTQLCPKLNTSNTYMKGVVLDLLYNMLNQSATRRGLAFVTVDEFGNTLSVGALHSVHDPESAAASAAHSDQGFGIATVVNGIRVVDQIDSLNLSDKHNRMLRAALALQAVDIQLAANILDLSHTLLMLLIGTDFSQGTAPYTVNVHSGASFSRPRARLMARYIVKEIFNAVANNVAPGLTITQSASQTSTQKTYSFILAPSDRGDPMFPICRSRCDYLLMHSSRGQLETGGQAELAADMKDRIDDLMREAMAKPINIVADATSAQMRLSAADLYCKWHDYQRFASNPSDVITVVRPQSDFKEELCSYHSTILNALQSIVSVSDAVVVWQGDAQDNYGSALVAACVDGAMERRRDIFPVRLSHYAFVNQFGALIDRGMFTSAVNASASEMAADIFEQYLTNTQASIGTKYVLLPRDVHTKLLRTLYGAHTPTVVTPTVASAHSESRRVDARRMATVFHMEEQWLTTVSSTMIVVQHMPSLTAAAAAAARLAVSAGSPGRLGSGRGRSGSGSAGNTLALTPAIVCELTLRVLLCTEAVLPRPVQHRLRWAVLVVLRVLRAGCWEMLEAVGNAIESYSSRQASTPAPINNRTHDEVRILSMLVLCDVAICTQMLTASLEIRATCASMATALFSNAMTSLCHIVVPRRSAELGVSVTRADAAPFNLRDLEKLVAEASIGSAAVMQVLCDHIDTAAANTMWAALSALSTDDLFRAITKFSQSGNSSVYKRVTELMNVALQLKTTASSLASIASESLLINKQWLCSASRTATSTDAVRDDPADVPYFPARLPHTPTRGHSLECDVLELEMARRVPQTVLSSFSQ